MSKKTETKLVKGKGSLLVAFDLTLDTSSDFKLVGSPSLLDAAMRQCIDLAGMERRNGMLDVWEMPQPHPSPATSFHCMQSLQESHLRVSVQSSVHNFMRTETWPDRDRWHLNGEGQLCNYSRDNTVTAQKLVWAFIEKINPATASLTLIQRGPDLPMAVVGEIKDWKRGHLVPLFKQNPDSEEYVQFIEKAA